MADFASNVPISRPIDLQNFKADLDFNGLMWSHDIGFMFQSSEDFLPFRMPGER